MLMPVRLCGCCHNDTLDLSGEVNLTSHLSYKWATGMRESSLQPFLAETRRDTKARERQDKLFVQHIKIDSVPKDAYVLSQIWGCEKVPGSEFIANLGFVKRVIKQRKSVTLTRE